MSKKLLLVDICNTVANINHELDLLGYDTSVYPNKNIDPTIFNEDLFRRARPILPVIEKVWTLKNSGLEVIYLTARPKAAKDITLWWLKKHRLPEGDILFSNGRLKAEVALDLNLNIFGAVEDSPQEVLGYLSKLPQAKVFMPVWEYNRHLVSVM